MQTNLNLRNRDLPGHVLSALLTLTFGALLSLAAAAQGTSVSSTVVPVEERHLQSTVTLGGTVVPYKNVTLSAQLPGRVVYLAGTEGDPFEEGTVLAALDEEELKAQQSSAYAALRDADAGMRNAGVQYSRELIAPHSRSPGQMSGMGMPSLFDQFFTRPFGSAVGMGNPTLERQADLYSRSTQIETSRNAYLRAQSQIQQLEAKLRDTQSIAPFTGVITRKLVEEGDTVQPGSPLLEFADTEYLQIQVDVPASLMPGIRKGMILGARLDVRNTTVAVRVGQIFPVADPERHTVRVKFDIETSAPAAPGMYASVSVPDVNVPVRKVLVIPSAAILDRGSLPMVEVVKEDNRKELRIVRTGEHVDRDHMVVLSGLRRGDLIHVKAPALEPPRSNWSRSDYGAQQDYSRRDEYSGRERYPGPESGYPR